MEALIGCYYVKFKNYSPHRHFDIFFGSVSKPVENYTLFMALSARMILPRICKRLIGRLIAKDLSLNNLTPSKSLYIFIS